MAGNLSSRIALRGTEDEFDRLSETINGMLDRISVLMDNLGQVTNDIAHDLRTPVTHLRHRLERARSQAVTPEEYARATDAAIAATDDILGLFGAHLRIAQIEGRARQAGFTAIDLCALLAQMQEMYAPVAEDSGHHLALSRMDLAIIQGDRELLVQLMSNLIENAIVHTPAGTLVTLSVARSGGEAIVTVADNGPGVPAQEHDKLFRRLYRREASRTRPGYGLGLALVAAIADLHGASLSTDKTLSRGFSVSLAFALSAEAG
jgi:signal transduction histidine kinase